MGLRLEGFGQRPLLSAFEGQQPTPLKLGVKVRPRDKRCGRRCLLTHGCQGSLPLLLGFLFQLLPLSLKFSQIGGNYQTVWR